MKIVVLCPHPQGSAPGQRLKFEQYYESWERAGFTVDVRAFWSERSWDILYQRGHFAEKTLGLIDGYRRRIRDFVDATRADLVYVFLESLPLGPTLIERLLNRRGIPMIYDIDDLIYTPHSSAANPLMKTVRLLRGTHKVRTEFRLADHVIVNNDYLRSFAEQTNPKVTKIWPSVDLSQYPSRTHTANTEGVVVGWSGSHSTSPYLLLISDVLKTLQDEDHAVIRVLGDPEINMPGVDVDARPWTAASEVIELSQFDIGLHPLPDEQWVLGKTSGKLILYMALGIPVVAQRIGSNLEIIHDGNNGFLVSTSEEWLAVIRQLISDPELRAKIGDAGRQTIAQKYSLNINEARYLDILHSVLKSHRSLA